MIESGRVGSYGRGRLSLHFIVAHANDVLHCAAENSVGRKQPM
jgi:hypothetical protein